METAIILFQCKDQKGIVANISQFLLSHDANIIDADQHSTDPVNGYFFLRIEFYFDEKTNNKKSLEQEFAEVAKKFNAEWTIHYKSERLKMGILVSKQGHCLFDILYCWKSGKLPVDISFVISNHNDHKDLVELFGIPYHFIALNQDKKNQEHEILKIAKNSTDFLVLARYMQVLSQNFLEEYKKDIINIHHSFLPSFKGANPYGQAFEKGVKVIGATAHFVNKDLDEGPIIEQAVEKASHRDSISDLTEKGKNLEKLALAKAINDYANHRIIKHQNKTVVF